MNVVRKIRVDTESTVMLGYSYVFSGEYLERLFLLIAKAYLLLVWYFTGVHLYWYDLAELKLLCKRQRD